MPQNFTPNSDCCYYWWAWNWKLLSYQKYFRLSSDVRTLNLFWNVPNFPCVNVIGVYKVLKVLTVTSFVFIVLFGRTQWQFYAGIRNINYSWAGRLAKQSWVGWNFEKKLGSNQQTHGHGKPEQQTKINWNLFLNIQFFVIFWKRI